MFVCNCNGLSCRRVTEAIAAGRGSVASVFQAFDARPQCGRCVPDIRALLDQHGCGCANDGDVAMLDAAE